MKKGTNQSVAIIGAGPAGSSCAIALLQAGFTDVNLIDPEIQPAFHIGESVPPDINPLLRELGLYGEFLQDGHEISHGSCSYWGSNRKGFNDSILSPYGNGWHLNRKRFNHLLLERVKTLGGRVLHSHKFVGAQQINDQWSLKLQGRDGDSRTILSDFVVDASGFRSVFALSQGIVKVEDAPLICLALRFKGKGRLNISRQTHLESVENGWWYTTKIPGEQLLVGLYTSSEVVKSSKLNSLPNWISLLQESAQTRKWIQHLEPIDHRLLGFGASSFCLDKMVGDSWAAIGDAASTYDPITSNGIMKSLTHGIKMGQIIKSHFNEGSLTLLNFEKEVIAQHEHYREMRRNFYELEQRWPQSAFWKEMHQLSSEALVAL